MALEPCEMCRIYLGKIPESLYIVPFQHKHTRTLTFENFCLDDLEILISNHIDFALTENLTDWPVARKAFFLLEFRKTLPIGPSHARLSTVIML